MHFAAINGRTEAINILVKLNARIDLQDCEGETAIHAMARSCGEPEVLELITKYAKGSYLSDAINLKNNSRDTALILEFKNGRIPVLEMLINHRVNEYTAATKTVTHFCTKLL